MSGLCGFFAPAGGEGDIAAMAASLARFDAAPVRSASSGWGALAAAARGEAASLYQDETRLAVVHGQLRFTEPELASAAAQRGKAAALCEAWSAKGAAVLERVEGSFALALLDRAANEAILAIDRIGREPLYYAASPRGLVFASRLEAIDAHPASGPASVDPQALYDYVHFHMVPAPRTIYRERRRLGAGTLLHWRNGEAALAPYWRMAYREDVRRPFGELKEEFRGLLRRCVSRAAGSGPAGSFLSGGTDSSTVAGMLREVTGRPPRTYSIGFAAEGFDEMRYARIAARHFGTQHHEYYVTPQDVVDAIPRVAAAHDQPFGNSSAVPTYYCARLAAQDGVENLLAGDGGDELFGGNARYATQRVYSLYGDLPGGLRKGLLEPLAFALPAVSVIGKVQRYMRTASRPMPARYDNYNLLERLGAQNVFTGEFLQTVDASAPAADSAQLYASATAGSLINRMLAYDLKYTLADNDLPKVARSCELAGVEPRFPLLDDSLVAFSARLAPELKLRGARLRYFFKKALDDFLPPEIIAKEKHGFGLPFGTWLRSHRALGELAADSLASLRKREIVRPQLIDQLTSTLVEAHAEYYGTMVWVLMMLEQWFQQRRAAT